MVGSVTGKFVTLFMISDVESGKKRVCFYSVTRVCQLWIILFILEEVLGKIYQVDKAIHSVV